MLARVLLLLGLSLSFCRSSARASAPRPIVRVLGEDDFFEVTSKGNYLVEFVKREEGDGRVHLNSEVIAEVAGVLKEEHGCLLATVDCDLHWRVCGQFPFLDAFPSLKLIKDRRVVEFRDYHGWLADMGDDVEQPSTLGEMLIHFVHGGTERAALIARPLPAKRTLLDDVLVQLMDNGPFSAKVWFADIKIIVAKHAWVAGLTVAVGLLCGFLLCTSRSSLLDVLSAPGSPFILLGLFVVSSLLVVACIFWVSGDEAWPVPPEVLRLRKMGLVAMWCIAGVLGLGIWSVIAKAPEKATEKATEKAGVTGGEEAGGKGKDKDQ